ncbi:MAG: hypothetical protein LR017_00580 [Candidatus Pacebacteria bacterium]|nr:hypothetical protein [Candidatus Paceibacterota bacterium]
MNLLFWALTIGVIGKVMLAVAVLRAHIAILHEHKIDGVVLDAIKRERWITIIGLMLIVTGYLLEIIFYGYTPMLTCAFGECAAAINEAL